VSRLQGESISRPGGFQLGFRARSARKYFLIPSRHLPMGLAVGGTESDSFRRQRG
jgi:hypothetical protein